MQFVKFGLLLTGCLVAQILPSQSAHQHRREGDRQYQESNYKAAEKAYRQAGEKKNDPTLQFNTGNAIYQQGNYAAAEPFFDQAAKTVKDPNKQADAYHNLGNAYLKQQKLEEAVNAYENSLRARPGDPDTKVNLQLAKKKLRQKQQNKQNQNQQDQQDQNQDQQDQQQNQQPQQPGDQQPQQQEQQNQQNPNQPNNQGRLSPEEARQLLETAVAPADKQNARKYREQEPGKHQVKPKKDW